MFTENEKAKLADGLILLIQNETQAKKFTGCEKAKVAIDEEIASLQKLLDKVLKN